MSQVAESAQREMGIKRRLGEKGRLVQETSVGMSPLERCVNKTRQEERWDRNLTVERYLNTVVRDLERVPGLL